LHHATNLVQFNDRAYIFANDSYFQNDGEEESFKLRQLIDKDEINEMMQNYIASNYKEEYFQKSHICNNKSIPVYDLGYDALHKVGMLAPLSNASEFFIAFPYLAEASASFLFNSETFSLDVESFDSILVDQLFSSLAASLYPTSAEEESKKIFDWLFSHMPKDSFYRLLTPKGLIKNIDFKGYGLSGCDDVEEYMYRN